MEAARKIALAETGGPRLIGPLSGLNRLDRLLQRAVASAMETFGLKSLTDNFRGLYVTQDDVTQLLAREPGASLFRTNGEEVVSPTPLHCDCAEMETLRKTFGLSDFDVDLIYIALAPEVDLRYEKLYAYLQDDVTRKRPTVDLALNLLCDSAEEKLVRRSHFATDTPLMRNDLVHLFPDPHQTQPSLLSHYFKLDEQVISQLLTQRGLDRRLEPFCKLVNPRSSISELHLSFEAKCALPKLMDETRPDSRTLAFYFQGAHGSGRRMAAEALANHAGSPLLTLDLSRVISREIDFDDLLKLVCREAALQNAVLYIDEIDAVGLDARTSHNQARFQTRLCEELNSVVVIAGTKPWMPVSHGLKGVVVVPFGVPSFEERRVCWQQNLGSIDIPADDLSALAGRFRLTQSQIASAAETARVQAIWRSAQDDSHATEQCSNSYPIANDLFAAARGQTGHDLASLARKIEPVHTWSDIVLPEDAMSQLREIVLRVVYAERVLGDWGFDRKLSSGKGINALFAGASGTGKTMAAEVIASELGLELYKIDLAGVVSKYIGETEKNLERIFSAAENANAILFFDEADALFGKRSEVHDAHDRYANIEVAYLLQKMEQYEGISLLATNMRQNMDEAFLRRLAFIVHFPFPDAESRRRIWRGIWPSAIKFAEEFDLDFLARQFRLSGGNIKNIALAAAFHAAADDGFVSMSQVLRATRREFQKIGKVMPDDDVTPVGL